MQVNTGTFAGDARKYENDLAITQLCLEKDVFNNKLLNNSND